MEMAGRKMIPETRETVWKALNDTEILRNCVPGCQSLSKTSDTRMEATAAIKVGPITAKFAGNISLSELNAPISYRITGEGQGGVAGFAKGSAFITLDEVEGGTLLNYSVDAQIGGKLAQLGGRLIDATARKMSEAFFEKFASEIRRQYGGEGEVGGQAVGASTSDFSAANSAAPPGPPAGASVAIPGMMPGYAPSHGSPPSHGSSPPALPQPAGGLRIAFLASLALAAVFAFLWLSDRQGGAPLPSPSQGLSPEFSSAVLLILIAAVGYLFGRLSDWRH